VGDWDEDKHPRDGGKFTTVGGGPHVANTERAAGGKVGEHRQAAEKRRRAASARRAAAAKEKDPARRSEHLARANHHDEKAAHHEERAAHHEAKGSASKGGKASHSKGGKREKEKGGLGEWVAKRLEGAREAVERGGDAVNEAEEKALEEHQGAR
jgi:hypothetical protein